MDDRTNVGVDRLALPLAGLLAAIAVGGALDLWLDWPSSPGALHVAFETAVLALSLAGVAWLGVGWLRAHRSLDRSREASARLSEERDH